MYNSTNQSTDPDNKTMTIHYHYADGTTHELTAPHDAHMRYLADVADLADLRISNPVAMVSITVVLDDSIEGHRQLLRQIDEARDQHHADDDHDPSDHAAVLTDFYLDWRARFGNSTTSPPTTTSDDDEREANERERGEGMEVEDVMRFLDEVTRCRRVRGERGRPSVLASVSRGRGTTHPESHRAGQAA